MKHVSSLGCTGRGYIQADKYILYIRTIEMSIVDYDSMVHSIPYLSLSIAK